MIKRSLCGVIFALAFTANANASSVTLIGPDTVVEGQSFEISVVGDFGAEGFTSGGIQIFYDAALATLDDFAFALDIDASASCPGASICPADDPGTLSLVWDAQTEDLIPANAGPTLMGTMSMTSKKNTDGRGIGSLDLTPVDFSVFTGGWFGADFIEINTPELIGASVQISAIPLPAAVWLMVGGLGALAGLRRK